MKKITLLASILFGAVTFAQVPANDLIQDAIDVDQFAQPYTDVGVNPAAGTSKTDGTTDCDLNGAGVPPFVWYKFTATQDGTLDVTYSDVSNGPGAPVYASSNGENATAADLIFETGNGNNMCGPTNSTSINTVSGTTYYVAVTNGGAFDVTLDITSSILSTNNFSLSNISLFPNPTTDILNIKVPNGVELNAVNVYSILGNNMNINLSDNTIDMSALSRGMYLVNLETSEGTITQKVTKK